MQQGLTAAAWAWGLAAWQLTLPAWKFVRSLGAVLR